MRTKTTRRTTVIGAAEARLLFGLLVAFACLVSCGQDESKDAPRSDSRRANHAKVLFTKRKVFLTKVGVTADIPALSAAPLDASTLTNSATDVISILPGGRMLALKKGSAVISSEGSQHLDVTVLDIHDLGLSPGRLSVLTGGMARLTARTSDGTVVDNDALRWTTTNPSLAYIRGDDVIAGNSPGRALLTASFGDIQATAMVFVEAPKPLQLSFLDPATRIRVGEKTHYRLNETSSISWSSSNARIVAPLTPGLFQARRTGVATVCAIGAQHQHACLDVEVVQ